MYARDINKNIKMIGTVVEVMDPHYGETIETEIYPLKLNGEIIDMVGTDKTGNIISIEIRDDKVVFDNTTTYGSLKESKVFGWCFDREGYELEGFDSSGYYKERIKGYKMKNDWLMNDKLLAMYINVMVELGMKIENKKTMILKYNMARINAKRNGASFKDEKEVVDLIITALEGIVLSKEEEKMVIEAVNSATIEYKINSLQG